MPPPTTAAGYRLYDSIRTSAGPVSSSVINRSYPVSPTRAIHHALTNIAGAPLYGDTPIGASRPNPLSFSEFYREILLGRSASTNWFTQTITILQAFQRGERFGNSALTDRVGRFPEQRRTLGRVGANREYRMAVILNGGRPFAILLKESSSGFTFEIGANLDSVSFGTFISMASAMTSWINSSSGASAFGNYSWARLTFPTRATPGYYWLGTTSSQLRDGNGIRQTLAAGIDDGDSVDTIAGLLGGTGPGPEPPPDRRHSIAVPTISNVSLRYTRGSTKTYSRTLPAGTVTPSTALPDGAKIVYSVSGLATGMSFNTTTRVLSFTYGTGEVARGSYTLTYQAEIDGYPGTDPSDREQFSIVIAEDIPDLMPSFPDCTPTGGV